MKKTKSPLPVFKVKASLQPNYFGYFRRKQILSKLFIGLFPKNIAFNISKYRNLLSKRHSGEADTEEHPVRAYDAFVDALSFNKLGIDLDARNVGNSQYHPHLMLKLLLFGFKSSYH